MNEIVLKTCGLQSGMLTASEVLTLFGVNVFDWPNLFLVGKRNQYVSRLPLHEQIYKNHLAGVQANWLALGC